MYWNLSDEYVNMPTRWLTLTWDVLKYVSAGAVWRKQWGLTLTWDVLK